MPPEPGTRQRASERTNDNNRVNLLTTPSRIFGLGITVVDHVVEVDSFPEEDTKGRVSSHFKQAGGPVPTALATAAYYGCDALLLSRWGTDDAGEFLSARLRERGVDVSLCQSDSKWETGFAHIWTASAKGSRTIAAYRGEYPKPDAATIDSPSIDAALQTCRILHLDGSWPDAALPAARKMRHAGGTVVLDAGSMKPRMDELIPLVDVLIGSDLFCKSWFNSKTVSDSDWLQLGPKTVFTTHGPSGAGLITVGGSQHCAAESIDAIDTNGAGDIFSGAVLNGIARNRALKQTLKHATRIATHSCTGKGNEHLPAAIQQHVR